VFQNSTGQNVVENPPIENQLSLTWDYNNNTLLYPNDEIYVTLTLKISSDYGFVNYLINNDVERFGFDMIISAVPVE
jgi:hypothetical protein